MGLREQSGENIALLGGVEFEEAIGVGVWARPLCVWEVEFGPRI